MQIINNIEDYLERLKSDYNLKITFHPQKGEYLISNSRLIKYNIHNSAFCTILKSNVECFKKCKDKQEIIFKRLETLDKFTGVCHAGVKERVYGFYLDNKVLGFISVSGYCAEKEIYEYKINKVCKQFKFNKAVVYNLYKGFVKDFPNQDLLDSLISPLCRMIEYGNSILKNAKTPSSDLYFSILSYINNHFSEELSLAFISKKFNISISQISHMFKKMNGKSFREYIVFLRLELAKNLLEYTNLTISEISFSVGFNDSCYFCNIFKKNICLTPNEFRNKAKLNI